MDDCEALINTVAREIGLGVVVSWQGRRIGLNAPWGKDLRPGCLYAVCNDQRCRGAEDGSFR